jgi:drug/metabolite transporter (DMT)-like permease
MSILLALLSSLLWGTADFVGGLASRRRPAAAVVGASQACGLAGVAVVAVALGAWTGPLGWLPWSVGAGLLGTAGLISFYAALSAGTMGVVSPIAALGAVVPVLVGVVAGEQPSAVAVSGIVVALLGAVAASGPELRGGAGSRPVLLAAAAGAAFGGALVLIARGAASDVVMTLVGMRLTSVLLFVVAALATRRIGGLTLRDLPQLALVGLGDAGANLLYALATQRGFLSVTAVLGSLYPVVTVMLARVVLRERLTRVQQVGVATALSGVVLVSLG